MRIFPKDRDLSEGTEVVELRVRASDFQAPADDFEIRLDVFLARFLSWRSRSSVQHLVRDGDISIDASTPEHPKGRGEFAVERRPGRRLRNGSHVKIEIPEHLRLAETAPPSEDLVVLYEDESVIAVDKPPMLVVHPSGRHLTDTLIQRVHAVYKSGELHRDARPRLCHRLDRETSGIVLIGKDPQSHQDLMRQFEQREVDKEYLAIVHGAPQFESGVVDLPLGQARASSIRLKMAVVSDGLESQTEWRVVRPYPGRSLIACRPRTGRQHQIRVHMDAIGHSLVGDKLYGLDEQIFQRSADGELTGEDLEVLELPRHALHNHMLAFRSPKSGEHVRVESPLAKDLARYLDDLEQR